jgi:hypothetical protein
MWVSTCEGEPLSAPAAVTGMANLFLEVCAAVDLDPFDALQTFLQENPDWKAGDFQVV